LTWFSDIFDRLLAGLCIAALACLAAQIPPFTTQYLARSGAELNRAQSRLADAQTGLRTQTMAEQVRAEVISDAEQKLAMAQTAHDALAKTTPLLYPLAIWRWAKPDVRAATWNAFIPALPTTFWSTLFCSLGALLGFVLYELLKWPVTTLLRAPRRRFRKRGLI
jgi:hypothetical protein